MYINLHSLLPLQDYIPACGTEEQTCSSPLITNGVLEVPINENVTGVTSGTVVNWVKAEAQVILNGTGIDIFAFDQIMVVARKYLRKLPLLFRLLMYTETYNHCSSYS